MTTLQESTNIDAYPRPIAWGLSEVNRAKDPVRRFHHLLELAEETIRYLTLIGFAQYLDLRQAGHAEDVDRALQKLHRPSFGDWVEALAALEHYLSRVDVPPMGRPLTVPLDCPSLRELACEISGSGQRKISILSFCRALVTLRNNTRGHGGITETQARTRAKMLFDALMDMLGLLQEVLLRPPVLVKSIEYNGPHRYEITILPFIGTGRPLPVTREIEEPGILRPNLIYLWGEKSSPLQLSPLAHCHQEQDALFLLSGLKGRVPEYSSIQVPDLKNRSDDAMSAFEERAAFFLSSLATDRIGGRPTAARQTYARAVENATKQPFTPRIGEFLKLMRIDLCVSEDEARLIHEEYGIAKDDLTSASGSSIELVRAGATETASRISIASIKDVIDWNWDGKTLLDHLIKIDYATITGLTELTEGAPEQWSPVFMEHPDTWRLLVDGPGCVVGYWHFVPLFEEDYQAAKFGKLLDGQITTDRVCFLELPGVYKLYFVSIAILPRYRGMHSLKLLMEALFNTFIELARHDVYFSEICTNAFTPEGVALCRTVGMQYLRDHEENGKIFAMGLHPLPKAPMFAHYPALVESYARIVPEGGTKSEGY